MCVCVYVRCNKYKKVDGIVHFQTTTKKIMTRKKEEEERKMMIKISGEMVGKKTKEKKLSFIIIQTGIMKEKKQNKNSHDVLVCGYH